MYLGNTYSITSHKVYCDMENERCGSKGWTRVALVDMSDNAQSCPGDLHLCTHKNGPGKT